MCVSLFLHELKINWEFLTKYSNYTLFFLEWQDVNTLLIWHIFISKLIQLLFFLTDIVRFLPYYSPSEFGFSVESWWVDLRVLLFFLIPADVSFQRGTITRNESQISVKSTSSIELGFMFSKSEVKYPPKSNTTTCSSVGKNKNALHTTVFLL